MLTTGTRLTIGIRVGAAAALLCGLAAGQKSGEIPDPLQPGNVQAVHVSGQTFLTWDERPEEHKESYRIYRSDKKFTDIRDSWVVDIDLETWESSGEFFADRVIDEDACEHGVVDCGRRTDPIECFRPRYLERFWIPDGIGGAREVPAGEGLLAYTLRCGDFAGPGCAVSDGWSYYAVTTVNRAGFENPIVTDANRVLVYESVADPLPVAVPREFADCSKPGYCPLDNLGDENPLPPGVHLLVQYMDVRAWNTSFNAPNFRNCWWGEDPNEVRIQNNRQYAYAYTVSEPDPALGCPPGPLPLVVDLHYNSGGSIPQGYGPAAAVAYAEDGCAMKLIPIDVGDTWWFGFSNAHDYRRPFLNACVTKPCADIDDDFPPLSPFSHMPVSGVVFNYTEYRLLKMIDDLRRAPLRSHSLDDDRIYVQGTSMGASGAMQLALRYPNLFAAAAVGKPVADYREYLENAVSPKPTVDARHELVELWGPYPSLAAANGLPLLNVVNVAPAGMAAHLAPWNGTVVWDWQDLIDQVKDPARFKDDTVPMGIMVGYKDKVAPYVHQGQPLFWQSSWGGLGRTWAGKIACAGHGGDVYNGMPPWLMASATNPNPAPFSDYNVRRAETVPGFLNLTGGHYPAPPTTCCNEVGCVPWGTRDFFQDLSWSSTWYDWDAEYGAPLDTANRWEVSLRWEGSFSPPPAVDVVPRRRQQFVVDAFSQYRWMNVELGTGSVIQPPGPFLKATSTGVLRIPAVQLTPAGNRIIIVRFP